ncbi:MULTISPECIES: heterocyst frequency control protein PatD [Pseudanabaena]|uniref:heterocyst frequency control protein PatD n=1 Tax=Pseudanabaena TaxID=1152 RepID=UPI00247B2BAB|nr:MULTISPECIES: heterocyst frequency control protein PatD [Pseudanabaena]MEA5487282.1 heterocyst frequency control protein PatD [Pseudanabaena sp. CCNP1317]WGS70499.1 heterocyst frequency control protein PatD [Pseudanabaena galeata CCNP1313]
MAQDYGNLIDDLQEQLERLQILIAPQSEPASEIVKEWRRSLDEIQKFFQSKIINTNLEITPQNLSLQVEIDKQLKMLSVDLSMLQTSRSQATWQKRHQQACDRFTLLARYCQMH